MGLSKILVVYSSSSIEIDAQGYVTKVIDGDTIDVSNFGRIRLADIDCPETGEAGYYDSKNYLSSLVYNKLVYIDKDEKLGPYDRFICIIYVRWNSTYLLNVNEALLNKGFAVISNYQNEFNPYTWTLYVYHPASDISTTISCSSSLSEINIGSSITISGAINPSLSMKTVTLTYKKPDGSTFNRTTITNSYGSYSDIYIPDTLGSWSVTASWDGDSTHDGSSRSSKSFTVKKSGCLIATATYGSELSPQVQFLRGFRDNTVISTVSGSSFMKIFNGFYYSFSPSVASFIADNLVLRDIMKVILYPLIGILHVSSVVFSIFSFLSELGVVIAGLVASSLIGIVYFLPTALIISLKKKFQVSVKIVRLMGLIWISNVLTLVLAEITKSPSMMIVTTGAFVLVTITTVTLTSLRIVSKRLIH